jgi:uncharacterized protein
MLRPQKVFAREWEWQQLATFRKGLGVVSGRRRHGKSFLLRELTDVRPDSIYHQALATRHGWPAPPRFDDWEQALRSAFTNGVSLVVLDEFPYLLRSSPELLSVVQLLIDDWRQIGAANGLVLCGSSLSVMSTILGAASPLHGRATLDLSMPPFDYRTSAAYWQAPNERVAFVVDAIFGGAPGYRELMDGRLPTDVNQLGEWLATGPLNPAHVLFSEDDYLLREEASFNDRAHYLSILRAVAHGATTSSTIAAALGRDARSLHHSLNGLVRAGFVESIDDALRDQRPIYRLTDPLVRFCQLITRPSVDRLEQHRWEEVVTERGPAMSAGLFGPHFEHLCRIWVRNFASAETLGGTPSRVAAAVLSDARLKQKRQLDAVAISSGHNECPRILAIGEAKYTSDVRGMGDVQRLDDIRNLVVSAQSAHFNVEGIKLMLFSANGFEPEVLRALDHRTDLILVDLADLYARD